MWAPIQYEQKAELSQSTEADSEQLYSKAPLSVYSVYV